LEIWKEFYKKKQKKNEEDLIFKNGCNIRYIKLKEVYYSYFRFQI
jgi:hypothetical protein